MSNDGSVLKVVSSNTAKPKKLKGEIEIAKCRRCERETGVAQIDFGVMHTGGFIQDGKLKDAKKALYCLHCHSRDGHVEIIAYL